MPGAVYPLLPRDSRGLRWTIGALALLALACVALVIVGEVSTVYGLSVIAFVGLMISLPLLPLLLLARCYGLLQARGWAWSGRLALWSMG